MSQRQLHHQSSPQHEWQFTKHGDQEHMALHRCIKHTGKSTGWKVPFPSISAVFNLFREAWFISTSSRQLLCTVYWVESLLFSLAYLRTTFSSFYCLLLGKRGLMNLVSYRYFLKLYWAFPSVLRLPGKNGMFQSQSKLVHKRSIWSYCQSTVLFSWLISWCACHLYRMICVG